nr:CBM_HP1_G0003800.mRNA.1.CDS.1 [Saccharomyces cerevisiae]
MPPVIIFHRLMQTPYEEVAIESLRKPPGCSQRSIFNAQSILPTRIWMYSNIGSEQSLRLEATIELQHSITKAPTTTRHQKVRGGHDSTRKNCSNTTHQP